MGMLEAAMPDPACNHGKGKHALKRRAREPEAMRQGARMRQRADGKQQKRDRNGREEGDLDRMIPLVAHRPGMADQLQEVEEQDQQEHSARHRKGDLGKDRRQPEGLLRRMKRQSEPAQPHDDGEKRDRKMHQPAFAFTGCIHNARTLRLLHQIILLPFGTFLVSSRMRLPGAHGRWPDRARALSAYLPRIPPRKAPRPRAALQSSSSVRRLSS